MRIGLLGGTFDPIHIGHLIVAEDVRVKLALEEVIFIPAGQPWLKTKRVISSSEHRLAMVRLATGSNPYFVVSTIEVEHPGPSYTVDTVAALRAKLGPEVQLFFIIGFDALSEFPIWKDPSRLIELCHIVGMRRPGHAQLDWGAIERRILGASSRIIVLDVPQIEISSTEIRERVAQGLSIRYLVPGVVEKYILEHRLYAEGGG